MKLKSKFVFGLLALIIVGVFGYWEYVKSSCSETIREKLAENHLTIEEGKIFADTAYKICMRKRGF